MREYMKCYVGKYDLYMHIKHILVYFYIASFIFDEICIIFDLNQNEIINIIFYIKVFIIMSLTYTSYYIRNAVNKRIKYRKEDKKNKK